MSAVALAFIFAYPALKPLFFEAANLLPADDSRPARLARLARLARGTGGGRPAGCFDLEVMALGSADRCPLRRNRLVTLTHSLGTIGTLAISGRVSFSHA